MRSRRILILLVLSLCSACAAERTQQQRSIRLVPIGVVSADLIVHLQGEIRAAFGREVTIGTALPLPAAAYDGSRHQYLGSALLEHLGNSDDDGAERVIGVIDADAYAPGLNFIFGQATKPGRFAVVALPRLRESFRGRPEDPVRFRARVVKVTVHELRHSFGFAHCETDRCVMSFARSVGDVDRQDAHFCEGERQLK